MTDYHRDDLPEKAPSPGERWLATLVAAVFFGLMGAELVTDFEPVKLAGVFVPLFWLPMLALHEAGHAVAARLCGWEVDRVVIGFGKTIRRFTVAGIPVLFKRVPLSGYVLPRPCDLHAPRLKNTLIYAGGPGIELLLLGILAVLVGPDTLLTRSDVIPTIVAQSLCVTIVMGLVFTLVPHHTRTGGGTSWSDGMGILSSWRLPDEYFAQFIGRKSPDDDES